MSEEKSCNNCCHLDEYFGDCTHPKAGYTKPLVALEECLEKNFAWWKERIDK